jgi:hypothetical protein
MDLNIFLNKSQGILNWLTIALVTTGLTKHCKLRQFYASFLFQYAIFGKISKDPVSLTYESNIYFRSLMSHARPDIQRISSSRNVLFNTTCVLGFSPFTIKLTLYYEPNSYFLHISR